MEIYTYSDFLQEKTALTFEDAHKIYNELISSFDIKDPIFLDDWTMLIELAAEYTEIRVKSATLSKERQGKHGELRTSAHNAFIVQLNALKSEVESKGKDTSWFDKITDDRQRQGDFANYLAYIYAVSTRSS
ncbi:conserved hypothetical protein [Streptococcus mitis B6]|jgi:hypothetical protein|uniref:Uncharacterized protein n=1 Tax=Streptococcus mitis (strain B6) TaxID=365659 RepID=D3HAX6_STRM6|nr:hypothetical protein [Streptococcus mitis]CBJ23026.1 conserved hypothetical protein [Streptococcus mitis B6]VLR78780.1 Uncharacterised protein [Streptococcus pneumoniae]